MNELGPAQIIWPLLTIAVAIAFIAAVKLNRRFPPLPEELAKTYATQDMLDSNFDAVHDRIDREVSAIRGSQAETSRKLDALIATTNRTSEEAQRSLGRIEGKLDAHLEQH